MPITPPLDNKQETVEYTTDPVGPYNDKESKEFRERLRELEPFVSSQRISMHQVAAAMKALAHKGESTEE